MGSRAVGSPLRPILESIALVIVAFVVSIVVGVVFAVPLIVLEYDIQGTYAILGLVAAGQVGMLLVAVGYVYWRDVSVPIAVPDRSDATAIAVGTLGALAVAVVLSLALDAAGLVPDSVIGDIGAEDPTFLLALAVLSVVLIAPTEELLFRGAIQGKFRQRFSPVAAVAGSSLLFGAMHLANYGGAIAPILAGAALIAVVGAVLGAVYERSGNLVVPITVHAIYNVVLLVLAYATI